MSCFIYCYVECHYAECHGTPDCSPLTEHPAEQRQSISIKRRYAECHVLFIVILNVVILSVMVPQIAAP
jgi:hypothetical protein